MKKLELTVNELRKIVAHNEVIGQGAYGRVFKLDDNTLFKFKYKEFFNDFEEENRVKNYFKLKNISETIKMLKSISSEEIPGLFPQMQEIINHKDKIKLTKLTQGIVVVNGYCVGYLLHNHKDMENLYNYLNKHNLSIGTKKEILNKIKVAVKELTDNNIFMLDLSTRNILINPKTNDIQLIDFEDATTYKEDNNEYYLGNVEDKFERIEKFMLQDMSKEKQSKLLFFYKKIKIFLKNKKYDIKL